MIHALLAPVLAGAFTLPAGDAFVSPGCISVRLSTLPVASITVELRSKEDDDEILSLPMFIDEAERLSSRPSTALAPEEMVLIAKRFLASSGGLGGDPALLSP